MILKLIFVFVLCAFVEGYTPNSGQYLLELVSSLVHSVDIFDGPASISNAPTITNGNKQPSLKQMKYYNYYAVSTYFGYNLDDLNCVYCKNFKDDIVYSEVVDSTAHNTLALVTLSEIRKEIVVAFRGTSNIWNIICDALLITDSASKTQKNVKIHTGINIATMSLFDGVVELVEQLLYFYPGFKVVLTGHSLGGGMVYLTYFHMMDRNLFRGVKFELYTYGSPRVGNKAFADFINRQKITTARVVARADIVPHVAPTSLLTTTLLGDYYVHPQTEFWINGEDNQNFCSRKVYEDPKCSMSLGPLYTPLDHYSYFDVKFFDSIGQPLLNAFGLLDVRSTLPPLPKFLEDLIVKLFGGGELLSGLLG